MSCTKVLLVFGCSLPPHSLAHGAPATGEAPRPSDAAAREPRGKVVYELGVLRAGGSLPVAPFLANAHLYAWPVDGGEAWQADEGFWLGACSHTRRQAKQLQRLQLAFGLPPAEQLRHSWACSLVATPAGPHRPFVQPWPSRMARTSSFSP